MADSILETRIAMVKPSLLAPPFRLGLKLTNTQAIITARDAPNRNHLYIL
jgi:hypothetical protein